LITRTKQARDLALPAEPAHQGQPAFPAPPLEAIAEATTEGILVVDEGGRMTYFNHRFVELWAIPDEVVARRRDDEAIAAVLDKLVDPQAFQERIEYLYAHKSERSRDEIRLRDGRVIDRYSAPVIDATGAPRGRVWFFSDVSAARQAQESAELLARSGELFGSALEVEQTLSQLAALVVPGLADWTAVDMLDETGAYRRVGVAHVDPEGARLLADLDQEYPLRPGEGHLRGQVVATGEPVVLYEVTDAILREVARDKGHRDLLRRLGMSSAVWVPLVARERVLGVISLGYGGERRYRPADLDLLLELGRRAGLAIDNALLFRAVDRAQRRHAAVADLGQRALAGPPLPALLQAAAESLSEMLETPFTEVLELTSNRRRLLLVGGVGWRPGMVGHATVDAGKRSQGGYALATVGPVVVEDLGAEERFKPSRLLLDHGVKSGLAVIIGGPTRPYGALGAFDRHQRRFAEDDVNFVQAVANVLATAIDRRLSENTLTELAGAERSRAAEVRAVINSIGEAVVVLDAKGSVILANPAAEGLLGRRLRSGMASILRAFAWSPGESREIRHGHPIERRLARREEPERWLELHSYPVEIDLRSAGAGGTILIMRDVTATRNARAVREAFAGILSHELRTPVTTIFGGSQMLVRGGLDDHTRHELYEDIRAEADRLYRLVENLLVLSHVEQQGLEVEREPVLLQRLLPRVVQAEGARWPQARFSVDMPVGLPPVAAEDVYLEQVVRNLVSNAAKYGGRGTVTVTAATVGDSVRVSVRDRGAGFDSGEAERLFELFYRAPSSARRASGAGVGLFVSRQLILAMGGRMWASSLPGEGAEFIFEVPVFGD
jgi:signal transduction histidine kinase